MIEIKMKNYKRKRDQKGCMSLSKSDNPLSQLRIITFCFIKAQAQAKEHKNW